MTNRPMPLLTIPVGSSATRTKLRLILLPPSTSRLAPNGDVGSRRPNLSDRAFRFNNGSLPPAMAGSTARLRDCAAPAALGDRRPQNRTHTSFNILIPRRPRRYTDAHCRATLPLGRAAPAGPIALYSFDHLSGAGGVTERNQNLVEYHFIQNLTAALPQRVGEMAGKATAPVDELRQAGAS